MSSRRPRRGKTIPRYGRLEWLGCSAPALPHKRCSRVSTARIRTGIMAIASRSSDRAESESRRDRIPDRNTSPEDQLAVRSAITVREVKSRGDVQNWAPPSRRVCGCSGLIEPSRIDGARGHRTCGFGGEVDVDV